MKIERPIPLERRTKLSLPLYAGRVEAGFPSPADDHMERMLDLIEEIVRNPAATFFVRVQGHSMKDAGIHPGDILVVDRSLPPSESLKSSALEAEGTTFLAGWSRGDGAEDAKILQRANIVRRACRDRFPTSTHPGRVFR